QLAKRAPVRVRYAALRADGRPRAQVRDPFDAHVIGSRGAHGRRGAVQLERPQVAERLDPSAVSAEEQQAAVLRVELGAGPEANRRRPARSIERYPAGVVGEDLVPGLPLAFVQVQRPQLARLPIEARAGVEGRGPR